VLSIRWRLTIFHMVAILVIAALLLGILAVVTYRGVTASVEETAQARANAAARLLESGASPNASTVAQFAEGNVFVVVRDAQGRVIAQTANRAPGIGDVSYEDRQAVWRDVLATGQPVARSPRDLYVYAVPVATNRSAARIVESWKSYDEAGQNIIPYLEVVTLAVPAGLLLAIVGSYLLAGSALSPVNAIVQAAREIGERDLSRRLPVKRPRDELGRLASTFNDLLARLDVAFRQREETLARQRRFVADASHELRTPLTSIQGYARMLRQWALDDPATARESVAAIEREAARMSELVESLLLLARGDEGAPLERAEHDLRDVASAAVDAARTVAGGKVAVVFQPPSQPIPVTVDRDRVHQAIAILLDNAVKYTPVGGTVTVAVRSTGDGAEVQVADTGPGIPAEHLPHIFDRFYRVDEARSAGGTGLGLAIARQIAETHGGTLDVESRPGSGSTFVLRLPCSTSVVDSRAAGADRDATPARLADVASVPAQPSATGRSG
jgi:two-component system, OmpR family, sensor kinase